MASHPIQNQAPLLRRIAAETDVDLTAFFCSDFSVRGYRDREFGQEVAWDVPLTEGYRHRFLRRFGPDDTAHAFWPITESIGRILRAESFDAVWCHGYSHPNTLRTLLSAHRAGIKTLVRSDIFEGSAQGTGRLRRLKDALVRRIFQNVDRFLA
ncbi:MAG: hypothetical protein MH204_01345, partial [Fimbriimonadaceae bacterium]|nr:hypothetical protein [Fimbriimonadaceae bacterium]